VVDTDAVDHPSCRDVEDGACRIRVEVGNCCYGVLTVTGR
jgi:hypothetical protein